jgi:hypothetical protein
MKYRAFCALAVLAAATLLVAGSASPEPRLLNRSIYAPIEFTLCEHLGDAVLYQDDQLVAKMPAKRVFQFTYYPDLEKMLPAIVRVRVEGSYLDAEGGSFVARLAITPSGIHTARVTKTLATDESLRHQRHKIDMRLEPRVLRLSCQRYCSKASNVATDSEGDVQ